MPTQNDRTARDLAGAPATAPAIEGCHIESCCGGESAETRACLAAAAKVQPKAKPTPLAQLSPEDRYWQTAPLTQLCSHIVDTHHTYVRTASEQLLPRIGELARADGRAHAELPSLRNLFKRLAEELAAHLMKEERILFPYIEQLEQAAILGREAAPAMFGTVRNPIRMMISEHDGAEGLLTEMRDVTRDYQVPADASTEWESVYRALREFEADLYQHIHMENDILFPRAIELEIAQSSRE
jgi:regulator of cell morphogenesis and NO signaling